MNVVSQSVQLMVGSSGGSSDIGGNVVGRIPDGPGSQLISTLNLAGRHAIVRAAPMQVAGLAGYHDCLLTTGYRLASSSWKRPGRLSRGNPDVFYAKAR